MHPQPVLHLIANVPQGNKGSQGGSNGCTQPPSASNPQPPYGSNQARTNHEGPAIC
ncbi:uncharacterized protein PGTG_22013 [Puccinia graminis f. sp. tritici CRL 75-36-700-3]|uniref:Uncharacterized protein n=1 Tax=Puccinia graminis f. sp. tritici (strain CRL 75-36-700-3 / race SCCL) TaxID=418459 RepID=H6QT64_PUCGT|nr:uncharacterized protein PGTG_22013 [Puccinia graminis f. sp. tritici CRL 75-36-700-3]EHS64015.1 hypothetical protein PGTG_22013 [Puccinia graminis f. sp. tritici CRL 75-36-700-3]